MPSMVRLTKGPAFDRYQALMRKARKVYKPVEDTYNRSFRVARTGTKAYVEDLAPGCPILLVPLPDLGNGCMAFVVQQEFDVNGDLNPGWSVGLQCQCGAADWKTGDLGRDYKTANPMTLAKTLDRFVRIHNKAYEALHTE